MDVSVLGLKGAITLGDGDQLLKGTVNSLLYQGHKKFVLNLAEVPYIDSAGLSEIVRTYTNVTRHSGSLKLSLTKRVTDLLAITKLLTLSETFEGDEGAEEADVGSRLRPRGSSDQQAISLPLPSTDSESE